jgi:predicted dienelactone hydrolase
MRTRFLSIALQIGVGLLACLPTLAADYDPLALPPTAEVQAIDFTMRDESRSRDIPLRVYLPATDRSAPVVLFSHGLGGTRRGCAYLGRHWSARGYVAVFLQHHGSDDSVWRSAPPEKQMEAMNRAASTQNLLLRVVDVPRVLDQLQRWNQQQGHTLAGRLDLTRIGMSGHSFGAATTQAVGGQTSPRRGQPFADRRIRAAIAFSPSTPKGGNPATIFGSVKIPWMLMTGTKDVSPIGNTDVASRLLVYPNLPATIDKYELVLHEAEHSVFTDGGWFGDRDARAWNQHRAILALSTAFWDAYLRDDQAARNWLQGPGARSVLAKEDRWQVHSRPAITDEK